MDMDKHHSGYIGDVVNGLAKEAAYHKSRAAALEGELRGAQQHIATLIERMKAAGLETGREEYISAEHTLPPNGAAKS